MQPVPGLDELMDRLPCYAVATTWHRAHQHRPGSQDRLNALYSCTPAVFRTMTAFLLSDFLRGERDPETCRKLARALHKPSDGHWIEACALLLGALKKRGSPCFLPQALTWFDQTSVQNSCQRLIQLRNQARHGGDSPGPAWNEAQEQELIKPLSVLLASLEWLQAYRLVRLEHIEVLLGDAMQARMSVYRGRDDSPRTFDVQGQGRLASDVLYLIHPEQDEALLVEPWMRMADWGEGKKLFLWEGLNNGHLMTWRHEQSSRRLDSREHSHQLFSGAEKDFQGWLGRGGPVGEPADAWVAPWKEVEGDSELVVSSRLPSNPSLARVQLPERSSPTESAGAPRSAVEAKASPEQGEAFEDKRPESKKPVLALGLGLVAVLIALAALGGGVLGLVWWKQHQAGEEVSGLGSRVKHKKTEVTHALKGTMDLRRIPAGSFLMGSPPSEPGRVDRMETQRKVRLTRDFWMQETEVTARQWLQVMGRDPSYTRNCGRDCPVEMVSWWDALAFANRVSQAEGLESCYQLRGCNDLSYAGAGCVNEDGTHTGWCGKGKLMEKKRRVLVCQGVTFKGLDCKGYRLPTEAEWEYAARAGTSGPTYHAQLGKIAWTGSMFTQDVKFKDRVCWEDGAKQMVALKEPNAFGLYDMIGNVGEWTWGANQAASPRSLVDPVAPGFDPESEALGNRIFRGGGACWDKPELQRAAVRMPSTAQNRSRAVGLRLVRTAR